MENQYENSNEDNDSGSSKSRLPVEVDTASEEGSSSEEGTYDPSVPNVLQIGQSQAPPGVTLTQQGQSEVITSAGGRRFVAQFFEESTDASADASGNATAGNTATNFLADDHMARALCINLLGELVKGSCQLVKNKMDKSNDAASNTFQELLTDKYTKIKDRIDDFFPLSNSDESGSDSSSNQNVDSPVHAMECMNPDTVESSDSDDELPSDRGFKKARHSSEIKCSRHENDGSCTSSESIACDSVAQSTSPSERKRVITDASSATRPMCESDIVAVKRQKLSQNVVNEKGISDTDSSSPANALNSLSQNVTPSQHLNDIQYYLEDVPDPPLNMDHAQASRVLDSNSDTSSNPSSCCDDSTTSTNSTTATASNQGDVSYQPDEDEDDDGITLSYLEKWQNHHIAKAIVDNAINKTLDDMALGPQEREQRRAAVADTGSAFTLQRQHVLDAGVSEVILQRGLRGQNQHQQATTQRAPLYPFINQLTEVTEDIFVETLGAHARFSSTFNVPTNDRPNAVTDTSTSRPLRPDRPTGIHSYTLTPAYGGHAGDTDSQASSKNDSDNGDDASADKNKNSKISERSGVNKNSSAKVASVCVQLNTSLSCKNTSGQRSQLDSGYEAVSTSLSSVDSHHETETSKQCVLDQAMQAVISEKGLRF